MKKYFYIYIFFGLLFLIYGSNYLLSDIHTHNIENKATKLPRPTINEGNEEVPNYRIIAHHLKKCKTFFKKYEEYYNDNFIFKGTFVKLYNNLKWSMATNPNPKQIIVGEDNWLFLGNFYDNINETILGIDTFSTQELKLMEEVQLERKRFLDSLGIDYYIMIAPEKSTIYAEKFPIKLNVDRTKTDQTKELLTRLGITVIFPKEALLEKKNSLQLYYKYDSHWNGNGAYIGYSQLMDSLKIKHPELQKLSISDFHVTTEYKNIENDLSNILFIESDWDNIPEYGLKNPTTQLLERRFDQNNPKIRVLSTIGNTKKLISLNDSYLPIFATYLGESFKEYAMYQFVGFPNFHYDVILKERPDIVVFEIVERSIFALCHK